MEPEDENDTNAFASPQAEDKIRRLAAENPVAHHRASLTGLILWITWLMLVLVGIVWLVG